MFPTLSSARLLLRPPRETDIDDLYALFSDPRVTKVWSHEAWTSRAQAEEHFHAIMTGAERGNQFKWAITEIGVDRLIGIGTLRAINHEHRNAMIGYALMPSQQGKGYARDAAGLILRYCFTELNLHRVGADLEPDNAGSRGVLDAHGFQVEGRLRETYWLNGRWYDSLVMGLLAPDWRERQAKA